MKKYLGLQYKRLLRIILPVILISATLFGCVMVAFDALNAMNSETEVSTRFKVGLVGTADDIYLQLGLAAMGSMDSTRFALELVEMDEPAAEEAMRKGEIAAFIVIPEGFLDGALRGEFAPLKFVSTAGSVSIVTLIKDEFTQMIQTMLIEAQKGIYGSGNAMAGQGQSGSKVINDISIAYADFIFERENMYRAQTQLSFNGLGMDGYFSTALSIVFFMLICLVFAPIMIRKDHALTRMLCAQRRGILMQVLCDFLVYLTGLLTIALVIILYLALWGGAEITHSMIFQGIPVILSLGAMSFLMYELASDFVSGVLLQFFVSLVLCFICGCMYPVTFFPEAVQALSGFLPVGLARMQIANCILNTVSPAVTLALLGYCAAFLTGSVLIRKVKATVVRG